MDYNRRRHPSLNAARRSRTPASLESLNDELLRLSSHRDDSIAITAEAIHADLESLGPCPSAQDFMRICGAIFKARTALPEGDIRAWRAAHGIARALFAKLLKAHKLEVEGRRNGSLQREGR